MDTIFNEVTARCRAYEDACRWRPHDKIDLNLSNLGLIELPECVPKIVNGTFNCSSNNLTSFRNCPLTVLGDFKATFNRGIVDLEHCPDVYGHFRSSNFLDSEYREFVAKRKRMTEILYASNDEAGLGTILDLM